MGDNYPPRVYSTRGGRSRKFRWRLRDEQLLIENEAGLRHTFSIREVEAVLRDLHTQFGADWFPLANNVEKMYHKTERKGLGSSIYELTPGDTFHAQGASYLGVVLEAAGVLEWNGEMRGIQWRIVDLPSDISALAAKLDSVQAIGGNMMSIRDKVLSTLARSGEMCDDCLSSSTAVKPRQSINICCRSLEASDLLSRSRRMCPRCKTIKLVNVLRDNGSSTTTSDAFRSAVSASIVDRSRGDPISPESKPWYWEGNVQERIKAYLMTSGWQIISSADTASRAAGKDIVATKAAETLWVSVKGWPEKSANVQARHWFSGALFDLVVYRTENETVRLAVGLPNGFATYRNLLPRVRWLQERLPFKVFLVSEVGEVSVVGAE